MVAEHAPDALSVHDREGRYLWASPAFHPLLGVEPEDLVGRDAYELFHPEDLAAIQVSHETVVTRPTSFTVQYRIRKADRTYRWVETSSRSVDAEQVIVSVTRPIDPRRSAMGALEAERLFTTRLRDFDRERHQFLTTVAHRARQPLTVSAGITRLLAEQWRNLDPDRIDELLARALGASDRLRAIVEQVTRAEGLARHAHAVDARPVDLALLVHAQVEAVTDRGGPVTVRVPEGSIVFADRELLAVALRSLLDNAVGHTPDGTEVWVDLEHGPEGAVITVDDAGPGIDPAHHRVIFDAFSHDADTPDPGLGLGLHTVAEIAAAHHGRAWAQDRPGGGTSFRLLLPHAPGTPPSP